MEVLQHNWLSEEELNWQQVPEHFQAWLQKPYILSKAFKRHCDEFSVRLLAQDHTKLLTNEVECLHAEPNQPGFVRQVYLQGDGLPWSYGRITIPAQTLQGKQELFEKVGDKPFGEAILYSDPSMQRSAFEYSILTAENDLYHAATKPAMITQATLYGRRSIFYLSDFPLLVTEIFLPDVPEYTLGD